MALLLIAASNDFDDEIQIACLVHEFEAVIGAIGEEMFDAGGARTVEELALALRARGGGFAEAFADFKRLRAAVDQEHAPFSASIVGAKEVAFFPAVTGG